MSTPGYLDDGRQLIPIDTPRGYELRRQGIQVCCSSCGRSTGLDTAGLVAAGLGDVPMTEFRRRFRCSGCGARAARFVVGGVGARDVKPW